ncbi:MAG: riboflavin biosynthesis protein RibF [Cephaloticoccus sp.]
MTAIRQFDGLGAVDLPATQPLHLAVGMFDGLHRGHQAVIQAARDGASREGGTAAVLTFWPHPSVLLRPANATRMIMDPAAKARVLAGLGVTAVITEAFTPEFAGLAAEEFVPRLKRALPGLAAIYVGENWRFGRGRLGDLNLLKAEGQCHRVAVTGVARVRAGDEPISSTRIRGAIEAGDMGSANALLGYAHFATGRVVEGRGLGRKLGFPTLNLDWAPELEPRHGVYVVAVRGAKTTRAIPGVANYGVRPTVESAGRAQLEVHLLGECPFTTGDKLTVDLLHFLRAEQKFSGVEALRTQIAADRLAAEQWHAVNGRKNTA